MNPPNAVPATAPRSILRFAPASLRRRLLQEVVHDRARPDSDSIIQSISRKRTRQNYAKAAEAVSRLSAARQSRILDIGPGYGLGYDCLLKTACREIVCVDYHCDAAEKFAFSDPRIRFLSGDFFAMADRLESGSFDVVVCLATVYYFTDPERLLAEVERLLAPGGLLVINQFDADAMQLLYGFQLRDISDRYGPVHGKQGFEALLRGKGLRPVETWVQSPVRLNFWSVSFLPFRMLFDDCRLWPAPHPESRGVYNLYIARKCSSK